MKKRIIISVAAVVILVLCSSAAKVEQARAEWMGGFQKMENADQAAEKNVVGALELYKESLAIFENVRRKYPQWNPTLLNYRINYCQQKIRDLEIKLENQANTLSSDDLLALNKRQAKQLQDAENARKELSDRVAFLTEALQRAREEAAKGAGYEATAANLAAAKANHEKEVADLRMQIKTLNDKIQELSKSGSKADKLSKELDKLGKRLTEATSELETLRTAFNQKKKEYDALDREHKQLKRNYDDKETALGVSNGLAESRKQELVTLRNSITSSEKKIKLLEKNKAELEAQLAAQRRREQELLEDIATQKKLREADAVTIGQLRAGADQALLSQAEGKRLSGELEAAKQKLKANEEAIAAMNITIADLREKYNQARAKTIASEEKNLENMSQLARIKDKQKKAEERALQLTAELEEAKILLGKSKSDAEAQQKKLSNFENVANDRQELERKLNVQTELARRQENQIAQQNEKIRGLEEKILADTKASNAKLLALGNELETSKAKADGLEKELISEKGKLLAAEKQLASTKEENARLGQKELELQKLKQDYDRLQKDSVNAGRLVEAETALRKSKAENEDMALKLNNAEKELEKEKLNADRLNEQLKAAKELCDKKDIQLAENANDYAEKLKAANAELEALRRKLQEQRELLVKERKALELKYSQLERSFTAGNESMQKQLKSLLQAQEENRAYAVQVLELNKKLVEQTTAKNNADAEIKKLKEEKKLLDAKVQVVDGLTKTVADMEEQLKEQKKQIAKIQDEAEAQQRKADAKYVSYETRLKEKDQIIGDLRANVADTPTWLARLKDMEKKYDAEVKNKATLEALLIDLENRLKAAQGQADTYSREARKAREEQAQAVRRAEEAARAEGESKAAMLAATERANKAVQEAQAAHKEAEAAKNRAVEAARNAQASQAKAEAEAAEALRKVEEAHNKLISLEKSAEKEMRVKEEQIRQLNANISHLKKENANQEELVKAVSELDKVKKERDTLLVKTESLLEKGRQQVQQTEARASEEALNAAKIAAEAKELKARQTSAEAQAASLAKDLAIANIRLQQTQDANSKQSSTRKSLLDDDLRYTREREKATLVKGFLRQGTEAERQGKVEAAKYNYQQALALDADNKLALQRLGLLASSAGNDTEASRFLNQAFKFDPDDIDTLLALGYAQARLGHSDWAVSYLGRAVALQPKNGDAVRLYGAALFTLGWTQAAETQLNQAIKLNAKDAEAQYNLAVLLSTMEPPRLEEASKWYKLAIKNGAQPDPGLDKVLGR